MKKILSYLMLVALLLSCTVLPVTALAAGGSVTVSGLSGTFASMDEAALAAKAAGLTGTITYTVSGSVDLDCPTKSTPDLAFGNSKVVIKGSNNACINLTGVYCGQVCAKGADLEVSNVKFTDNRKASGEGTNPDPWEFCYISFSCNDATFTKCTFAEGVMVGNGSAVNNYTFEGCTFKMEPQKYTATNGATFDPAKDYSATHYSLWLEENGVFTINNCTFKDAAYGAIKSTWNMYGTSTKLDLTVTNTTFDNIGNGDTHRPIHLDGASSVFTKGNTYTNTMLVDVENPTTDHCPHIKVKSGVEGVVAPCQDCNPVEEPEEEVVPPTSTPVTGDNSNITLWMSLMLVAALGMMLVSKKFSNARG